MVTADVRRGRSWLIGITCCVIGIDLLVTLFEVFAFVPLNILSTIIRFASETLLFYLTFKGHDWAKATMGILLMMGALVSVYFAYRALALGAVFLALLIFGAGILDGVCGGMMLFSGSIDEYVAARRKRH